LALSLFARKRDQGRPAWAQVFDSESAIPTWHVGPSDPLIAAVASHDDKNVPNLTVTVTRHARPGSGPRAGPDSDGGPARRLLVVT
jgi:hypothetical protein